MSKAISLVLLGVVFCSRNALSACSGCVELDTLTFDKLIPKFPFSLIKFDIAFPYGEKHEAFGDLAKKLTPTVDDLFIGLVGIKDYGEKENSKLAERYRIDEKQYPVILLFKQNSPDEYVKYPEGRPIDVDSLKEFIRENTGLYIGLQGCLKELDLLVSGYLTESGDAQEALIDRAQKLKDEYDDEKNKDTAKVYIAIMKRILDKGSQFVAEERRRLDNLLKGKLSDNKKRELQHRVNILQSFQYSAEKKSPVKDEF